MTGSLKKTPLHAEHLALEAKMGGFAGYDMPLYYRDGVMAEHEWVRSHAGLFDVSHMGQAVIEGPGACRFLETLTPSSFAAAPEGRAKYTVLTNERGGIVDDLIVTRTGEERFFAVINAGCKEKDIAWMTARLPEGVKLRRLDDRALLALQGPEAEAVLRDVLRIDTQGMPYMWMITSRLRDGTEIYVSRLGYTGEDGFELSIPAAAAPGIWVTLLRHGAVNPVGLAARDSLRLEMGYCLYGHDIDEDTTPVEAGLSWVIGKDNTGFTGADTVRPQMQEGTARRRTGIRLTDKGVAREGSEIRDPGGKKIGTMTSGGFSPTLKQAVGQGYVDSAFVAPGTKILVNVRGRDIAAEVAAMPFLPAKTKSMTVKK